MNTEPNDKDKRAGKVKVDLTAEQIEEAGEELARTVKQREALEAKKSTHVKEWNEQIRQLDDQISELAEAVDSGERFVDANLTLPGVSTAPKPNGNGKPTSKAPAKKQAPPKSKSKGKGSSAGARA